MELFLAVLIGLGVGFGFGWVAHVVLRPCRERHVVRVRVEITTQVEDLP